ncbi:MAG TPA: nucleotide exchange factor GrpE [Acidimicrobiales bacterium]|nr:nucleotide exchange factor GrpE [Acidimicrobiales bacterium]
MAGTGETTEEPEVEPTDELDPLVAELEDRLRRALADLDNLRKRFDREVNRERDAERRRVASEWLPVVDNLERAIQHAAADPDLLMRGLEAVQAQAVAALARLGFPRFEDVGERFDPARHEAVGAVETDEADPGTVAAAARPGYGTQEEVLRPASVVVTRSPD